MQLENLHSNTNTSVRVVHISKSTDAQFDLLVKPVTEMGSHIYSLCVFMSPNAHSLMLLLLLNLAQQLSGRAFFFNGVQILSINTLQANTGAVMEHIYSLTPRDS